MSIFTPSPRPSGSGAPTPAENEQAQVTPMPPATPLPPRRSRRSRRLAKPGESESLTGAQRLLLLDTWRRSGLPAGDFAALVGVSKHTLYAWNVTVRPMTSNVTSSWIGKNGNRCHSRLPFFKSWR
jgi:hypothetical protein